MPQVLNAARSVVPSLRRVQQLQLQRPAGGSFEEQNDQPWKASADELGRTSGNPLLDDVRRQSATAYAGSRKVERILRDGGSVADYPPMQLARHLAAVAQLIRADLGIRMFFVELGGGGFGGFDNHAGQKENHAALLEQMSQSVAAFFADLQQHGAGERVLLATCSEFGRTLSENGRRGTGHGEAAPVFVAGSQVNGGLIGRHPSLTDLEQDAPKYHTDFRRVYATLLERWLGFDSRAVFGRDFEPISALLAAY